MDSAVGLVTLCALGACLAAAAAQQQQQIPANWGTCPRSDPSLDECLKGAIQRAITDLRSGNEQLGLQSLDPFFVDQFHLNRGGNGPLTIDMAFSNAVIDGIRDVRVDSVKADLDRGEITVDLSADTLNMRSDYRVNGKVILIPINGDGQTFIRMDTVHARFTVHGHVVQDSSQRDHLQVDSFDFDIFPERSSFKFVSANPARSSQAELLSRVVTENDRSIMQELRPTISEAFSSKFLQMAQAVFGRVALPNVFPQ